MPDFIPDDDEEFNTYAVQKFGRYVEEHGGELGLTPEEVADFLAALQDWKLKWAEQNRAKNAFQAATIAKDESRRMLDKNMRQVARRVQANDEVTDPQREGLGVTVRKTSRRPVARPETIPHLQRVDISTRETLRLFIADSTASRSRAKPAGVQGAEIRQQIGGAAPVDPETMPFLTIATRTPYRIMFDPEHVSKPVHYALRWVNRRGVPGPWSQIYSTVVPS
jgi:hypothetical protein